MSDFSSAFQGKRVLVTGHTGFKGSWLALWLRQLGAEVLGYSLAPEQEACHFNVLNLQERVQHVTGDILDHAHLQRVANEFQPDIIFHLAAQALVRYSYDEPKLTFDTNIAGSVNVLEVVRTTPSVKALIYVTSDKCYRNNEWVWGYRESDEMGGHDPYSASKAAAELVYSAYFDSYFSKMDHLGTASVRAGNVIGGGDLAKDRIIPDTVQALRQNDPVILRNPGATRPWQHVLEPLSGYLQLAAHLISEPNQYSGSWNFGPQDDSIRTVQDLTEAAIKVWGAGSIEIKQDPNAPHEANLLHLSCEKANRTLHWLPRWGFDRTVSETIGWYKAVDDGQTAIDVSTQQILNYMDS